MVYRTPSFQYQIHVEPVLPPAAIGWFQPLSQPVMRRDPKAAIALAASGLFFSPQQAGETVTLDKWYEPYADPVRIKQGLRSSLQQPLAMGPTSPQVSFSWFGNLSDPVRQKIGLPAREQQFFTTDPKPVVSFSWFNELSKPSTLQKRGLLPGLQQTFAFSPLPLVSFGWFGSLSEPRRFRRGLGAPLQQFFATDPEVIPTSKLIQWFANLSEPVRFKPGLRASLQQALAWPPRLLPTPNISGTMSALETKDTFLAGAAVFNPPASAEIGIVVNVAFGTEIGVISASAPGTIASVSISVRLT